MEYEIVDKSEIPISIGKRLILFSSLDSEQAVKFTRNTIKEAQLLRNAILGSLRLNRREGRFSFKLTTRIISYEPDSFILYVWKKLT